MPWQWVTRDSLWLSHCLKQNTGFWDSGRHFILAALKANVQMLPMGHILDSLFRQNTLLICWAGAWYKQQTRHLSGSIQGTLLSQSSCLTPHSWGYGLGKQVQTLGTAPCTALQGQFRTGAWGAGSSKPPRPADWNKAPKGAPEDKEGITEPTWEWINPSPFAAYVKKVPVARNQDLHEQIFAF